MVVSPFMYTAGTIVGGISLGVIGATIWSIAKRKIKPKTVAVLTGLLVTALWIVVSILRAHDHLAGIAKPSPLATTSPPPPSPPISSLRARRASHRVVSLRRLPRHAMLQGSGEGGLLLLLVPMMCTPSRPLCKPSDAGGPERLASTGIDRRTPSSMCMAGQRPISVGSTIAWKCPAYLAQPGPHSSTAKVGEDGVQPDLAVPVMPPAGRGMMDRRVRSTAAPFSPCILCLAFPAATYRR